jgi:hypothetical protein
MPETGASGSGGAPLENPGRYPATRILTAPLMLAQDGDFLLRGELASGVFHGLPFGFLSRFPIPSEALQFDDIRSLVLVHLWVGLPVDFGFCFRLTLAASISLHK